MVLEKRKIILTVSTTSSASVQNVVQIGTSLIQWAQLYSTRSTKHKLHCNLCNNTGVKFVEKVDEEDNKLYSSDNKPILSAVICPHLV